MICEGHRHPQQEQSDDAHDQQGEGHAARSCLRVDLRDVEQPDGEDRSQRGEQEAEQRHDVDPGERDLGCGRALTDVGDDEVVRRVGHGEACRRDDDVDDELDDAERSGGTWMAMCRSCAMR